MITSVLKIKTTQEEFDLVNQNDRPRMSEQIHKADKQKYSKAIFNPSNGEVTEEYV